MPTYGIVIIVVLVGIAGAGWVVAVLAILDYEREKKLYDAANRFNNFHIMRDYLGRDRLVEDSDEKLKQVARNLSDSLSDQSKGRNWLKNRMMVELYNSGFVIIHRRKEDE